MKIIRDLHACPNAAKSAVLALGNFDGVHLGHQVILKDCVTLAHGEGKKAAAMTFEPHPREFFSKDHRSLRIYPLRKKIEIMREQGIDILFLARFNQKLASTSAEAFVEDILHKNLGVAHVVTGYNFAFGKGRKGTTELLAAEGKKLGFGYTAVPPVKDKGRMISSSAIRDALAAGDMALASEMLGRAYRITGVVRHGHSMGKELGFPTANLSLKTLFKPRFGIYAARVHMQGKIYNAAVNIGIAPTLPHAEPLLEVHMFDMNETIYGRRIEIELTDYLREEKKFADTDALKQQIAADCKQAQELLARYA